MFHSGASSGIGEACAWRFAAAGCKLVLSARRTERLDALSKQLTDSYKVRDLQHRLHVQLLLLSVMPALDARRLLNFSHACQQGHQIVLNAILAELCRARSPSTQSLLMSKTLKSCSSCLVNSPQTFKRCDPNLAMVLLSTAVKAHTVSVAVAV